MKLPVTPPVEPMLARLVDQLPTGWWYEPKWDGFRAVVFRAGSEVLIESRNNRPMARYFPEVVHGGQAGSARAMRRRRGDRRCQPR